MAASDSQIKLLHVFRRRLQNDLQLRVLIKTIGVLAVAAVSGTARRLHVCDLIRLRPQHPQESFRRHGAGADFHVVGLLQHAAAFRPEGLEPQDKLLKRQRVGLGWVQGLFSSELD